MPTCIAMLRGVNVGNKTIKMERLRALLEDLGFSAVRTYVQSGNAIFETGPCPLEGVSKTIEEGLRKRFGFEVPVLLKTAKELKDVVVANPFTKQKSIDQSKLHVTFLAAAAQKALVPGLEPLAAKTERFCVVNKEVYLYCPDGYGRTRLSNNAIEKKLSLIATTRNWRTVNALLDLAQS